MKKNNKMAVLGGGLWGTVLAQHLAGNAPKAEVRLWEYFADLAHSLARSRRHPHIPGFRLDERVGVSSDLAEIVAGVDLLIFVLPSGFVRKTAAAAASLLQGRKPVVVNASKGIEQGSLKTMGEIIEEVLPAKAVFTLTGPSFAREVAKGVPTRMLLGGPGGTLAQETLSLFNGGALAVSWTPDRRGAELGGSLKNVLAIGCGVLDGMGAGANTKAALIIQGMEEMGRLAAASGGRKETVLGLAGLGDLIATGTSPESRNRAFGEKLGCGKSAKRALEEIPTVVEGTEAAHSAAALAKRYGVEAPLLRAIWQVVHADRPARTIVKALGFKDFN